MSDLEVYPRFAMARLEEALADTPVVLIHGPRQCGKSTLAQAVAKTRSPVASIAGSDIVSAGPATPAIGATGWFAAGLAAAGAAAGDVASRLSRAHAA